MSARILSTVVVCLLTAWAVAQDPAPASPTSPAAPPATAATDEAHRPDPLAHGPTRLPDPPNLSNDQIKELVRQVAENDLENEKRLRDYTYIEREETKKLNGKGEVTGTESKTYEVLKIYGEDVEKLIAENDKPLSEKKAAKEDEKIQKIIEKRKNESDSAREKRLKEDEKRVEEGRAFVKEVADAYNFKVVDVEEIDGRPTWVIDAEPRPGFVPHRREAKMLSKIVGRIWIDEQEKQWVKMDVRVTDTISFGLFLARLHEGTRVMVEQTRVNDEVWLPKHGIVHVDVRLGLLKNFDRDIDVTDRDYKKFRTGTRIVGMEEVKETQ